MKNLLIVLLVGVCYFQFTDAVCCPSRFNCSNPGTIRCADCSETIGFGHCGVGSCNIFGCSCDGGCKDEDTSLWCYQDKDYSASSSNETISLLKLYDTDSDSALSQEEFSALFKDNFDGEALKEFQTLDVNSDGYVSFSEIDSDF